MGEAALPRAASDVAGGGTGQDSTVSDLSAEPERINRLRDPPSQRSEAGDRDSSSAGINMLPKFASSNRAGGASLWKTTFQLISRGA
jgi:hypothetical protein